MTHSKNKKSDAEIRELKQTRQNLPLMEQDPREYEAAAEELMRQGYTDEGLTNPFEGEEGIPERSYERGRKVA
jgi:hypothetical protein